MILLDAALAGHARVGGTIKNGKFLVRTKPGKWRVQVEAVRATGQRDRQSGKSLGEMYIPARYDREAVLEAIVTRDGTSNFDFDLKNESTTQFSERSRR